MITGRNLYEVFVRKPAGGRFLEDQDVDWRVILKLALCNRLAGCVLDLSGSEQGTVGNCPEHRNEPAVSRRGGNRLVSRATVRF